MNALCTRMGWPSVLLAALLAGCAATPPTSVHQPMSARPVTQPQPAEASGGIYQPAGVQASYRYLPLFEDRRARNVGDSLIVVINERTNASKKSSSSVNRSGNTSFSVPVIAGLPGRSFENAELSAESDNKFNGGGSSASNNDFSGTIAVTVIEVLANNNLLVSGEKQVGINQGKEFIRFSGVVDPRNITGSNTVSSMQVADARIEYRGNGYLDEAQVMGWLSRFFLSFLPF